MVLDRRGIVNRHIGVRMRGATPQSVVCRVGGDPIDPRGQTGLASELRKPDAHLRKDVLRDVVAIGRSDHTVEIAVDLKVEFVVDGLKVRQANVAGGTRRHG